MCHKTKKEHIIHSIFFKLAFDYLQWKILQALFDTLSFTKTLLISLYKRIQILQSPLNLLQIMYR